MGSIVANDRDEECEVVYPIEKALAVFHRLKCIWAGRAIFTKTRVRLFNIIVVLSTIYMGGNEPHRLTEVRFLHDVVTERCLRFAGHLSDYNRRGMRKQ